MKSFTRRVSKLERQQLPPLRAWVRVRVTSHATGAILSDSGRAILVGKGSCADLVFEKDEPERFAELLPRVPRAERTKWD